MARCSGTDRSNHVSHCATTPIAVKGQLVENPNDCGLCDQRLLRPPKARGVSYFASQGGSRRARLETLFNEGHYDEVALVLGEHGLSATDLKALGAAHPMFMGGNYLPDMGVEEIEIACIQHEWRVFGAAYSICRGRDTCVKLLARGSTLVPSHPRQPPF